MTLRRSVLQVHNILWELYADTHSDVSDNSDSEILDSDSDSDSDVPISISLEQLQPSSIVFTSNSETSTEEEVHS
jgi:hypothetical protein